MSWLLTIAMLFPVLPMTALADDGKETAETLTEANNLDNTETIAEVEKSEEAAGVEEVVAVDKIALTSETEDTPVDGFYRNAARQTITGYQPDAVKDVTIPVQPGSKVTTIGANAFYNNNFTEISLPDTVTSVGAGAFGNCTNLTFIHCRKRE